MWKYEKVLRMYEEVWGSVRKLEKEGWRKLEKEGWRKMQQIMLEKVGEC